MVFTPLHDRKPLKIIRFQLVTLVTIALCCGIFLVQRARPIAEGDYLMRNFGLIPAVLLDETQVPSDSIWVPAELTILTAAFLHGSWLHLIRNMLFLWVFGDNVEDSMGYLRFAIFYLLCATTASLALVISMPDSNAPLVGASGAIAGVLGAYIDLHPRVKVLVLLFRRIPLLLPAYLLIGTWLVFQPFNLWSSNNAPVSWWAHIGGFVAGAVLIVPFRFKKVSLFDREQPPRYYRLPPDMLCILRSRCRDSWKSRANGLRCAPKIRSRVVSRVGFWVVKSQTETVSHHTCKQIVMNTGIQRPG